MQAVSNALEALVVAVKDGNPANIDNAVKGLDDAPHLDQESDQLKERLKNILTRAKDFGAVSSASPSPAKSKIAADELNKEFAAWQKAYNQWLKTGARSHSGLSEIETK